MTWPNGGEQTLHPKDYYRVRFIKPEGNTPAGTEGVVVDHVVSAAAEKACVVELGPWGRHGEPRGVVVVSTGKLRLVGS